jgi:outer membrane lipoprotein carrier protein
MKKLISVLFSIIFITTIYAQEDPHAKDILSKVSAKNKAYKSISTNFTVTTSNNSNAEKTAQKGSLIMKGDKYSIKLPDSEIYFDGKDVYNYLPASNEVNITKPQAASKKGDDFSISNPKDIFKIYEKNFKSKFIKESTVAGKGVFEVDLYPIDLQKKYTHIRLQIDKASYQLLSVKAVLKDGQQYAVSFDSFETNKELADSLFSFNKAKHPNAEVIDLRF